MHQTGRSKGLNKTSKTEIFNESEMPCYQKMDCPIDENGTFLNINWTPRLSTWSVVHFLPYWPSNLALNAHFTYSENYMDQFKSPKISFLNKMLVIAISRIQFPSGGWWPEKLPTETSIMIEHGVFNTPIETHPLWRSIKLLLKIKNSPRLPA